MINGARYGDEFDNATHFTKEPVTSMLQNVGKLLKGRIDLTPAYYLGLKFLRRLSQVRGYTWPPAMLTLGVKTLF